MTTENTTPTPADRLLDAALLHVPFDGWSETTLRAAIAETGAYLGFDPIGGGQASDSVLKAMEQVAASQMGEFSRYGSNQQKKMYIYGRLDLSNTILTPS